VKEMGRFEKLKGTGTEFTHNGERIVIPSINAADTTKLIKAGKAVEKEDFDTFDTHTKDIVLKVLKYNFKAELEKKEVTEERLWDETPYEVIQKILEALMQTAGLPVTEMKKRAEKKLEKLVEQSVTPTGTSEKA